MCGRFSLIDGTAEIEKRFGARFIRAEFETAASAPGPRYNAAPSMVLPIIIGREGGERELVLATWGFHPSWMHFTSQANARFDSAHERRMFKDAFAKRHCLIPANSFFEWHREKGIKQPYRILVQGGELFAMAGIWEPPSFPETRPNFAVLTTDANSLMQRIHDRMPVIVDIEGERAWLMESRAPMQVQYPASAMSMYPVTTKVNKVSFNEPDAIKRVADPSLGL